MLQLFLMKKLATFLTLLFTCIIFPQISNCMELLIVQTVTSTKKSFVVRKGSKDGIMPGQLAVFSTKKISILAKAVIAKRDFSMWTPTEEGMLIPFSQGKFVVFSSGSESLETNIPQLAKKKEVSKISTAKLDKKALTSPYEKENYFFILRGSYSAAAHESTTDVSPGFYSDRAGTQYELLIERRLSADTLIGFGIRVDNESFSIPSQDLQVTTQRNFFMLEMTYEFPKFDNFSKNLYASLELGYGKNATSVNDEQLSGTSYVMPGIHIGLQSRIFGNNFFIFDLAIESVVDQQDSDANNPQTTSIVNSKFGIGLKI